MNIRKVIPLILVLTLAGCEAAPGESPVKQTPLDPCPNTPNCVNSLESDPDHHIAPLTFEGSGEEALNRLKRIVEKMEGATIVSSNPEGFQAEFTTKLFGFVDDVSFLLREEDKAIHVRSASRVGYWDLGANRRRVEKIREAFEKGPGD
jgi:uncharacterized protein (DUF1499 family)